MKVFVNILVGLTSLQHFAFLYLEMFLWNSPLGMKVFKLDPEFAAESSALAANQGLYNGFLAAGLLWSLFASEPNFSYQLKIFFPVKTLDNHIDSRVVLVDVDFKLFFIESIHRSK